MTDDGLTRGGTVRRSREVVVTGSLAFDYIMDFPGDFRDHIMPDKVHVLSISFLVPKMKKQRGGTAGNMAYTLALLGQPCFHPRHGGRGGLPVLSRISRRSRRGYGLDH